MAKKNRNIHARIEYAELSAARPRKPAKERQPAPSDPDAVDCAQHDQFAWEIYLLRGLYAFHPQDKRLNPAIRLALRMTFWAVHQRRQA